MAVTILIFAAVILLLLAAFDRQKIGMVHTMPLGLACLALAMLWPTIIR